MGKSQHVYFAPVNFRNISTIKNNNLMGPQCMNVTLLFRAVISIAFKKKKGKRKKAPILTGCI
jgi:hypothetical protein